MPSVDRLPSIAKPHSTMILVSTPNVCKAVIHSEKEIDYLTLVQRIRKLTAY